MMGFQEKTKPETQWGNKNRICEYSPELKNISLSASRHPVIAQWIKRSGGCGLPTCLQMS